MFDGSNIKTKPVLFPHNNKTEQNMATILASLGDYDFVTELYKNDMFVQSWIAYKQGKPVQSIITAQDAMKNLYPKPPYNDLRWRLVYPLNYYSYADKYGEGENTLLILSIMREESHFNPLIESPAGAMGLMQLMPATANELAGICLCNNELYNPDTNIKLGSLYYSKLKKSLGGIDLYAIMSYNGGRANVMKWRKMLKYKDLDDFIEKIPYPETQMYVKKVFRSYWNYSNIYQTQN